MHILVRVDPIWRNFWEKHVKPDWMISAYVTLYDDLSDINDAFRTWLGNKYPKMYEFVMSEARKMSYVLVAPEKE